LLRIHVAHHFKKSNSAENPTRRKKCNSYFDLKNGAGALTFLRARVNLEWLSGQIKWGFYPIAGKDNSNYTITDSMKNMWKTGALFWKIGVAIGILTASLKATAQTT
jgi:hypothetical protein